MTQDAIRKGQSLTNQINALSTERDNAIKQHKAATHSLDTATSTAVQTSLTNGYNALISTLQTELTALTADYLNPQS